MAESLPLEKLSHKDRTVPWAICCPWAHVLFARWVPASNLNASRSGSDHPHLTFPPEGQGEDAVESPYRNTFNAAADPGSRPTDRNAATAWP